MQRNAIATSTIPYVCYTALTSIKHSKTNRAHLSLQQINEVTIYTKFLQNYEFTTSKSNRQLPLTSSTKPSLVQSEQISTQALCWRLRGGEECDCGILIQTRTLLTALPN